MTIMTLLNPQILKLINYYFCFELLINYFLSELHHTYEINL
jgi:hypothetical protein